MSTARLAASASYGTIVSWSNRLEAVYFGRILFNADADFCVGKRRYCQPSVVDLVQFRDSTVISGDEIDEKRRIEDHEVSPMRSSTLSRNACERARRVSASVSA